MQPANQYSVDLTFEEASGLRYAAGYVCRALKKKFATDSEFVECINELVKDVSDECPDSTSKWTQLASRGGLVHINDSTYKVFHAMELVVWQRFQKGSVTTFIPVTKNEVVGAIVADEGIAFYWCLVAVNMETRTANRLLHAIVELWVTIRGFSFCSGWMKLYKQETQIISAFQGTTQGTVH